MLYTSQLTSEKPFTENILIFECGLGNKPGNAVKSSCSVKDLL